MPLATPEELALYPPPALPRWILRPDKYGFPQATEPLLPCPEFQFQFLQPAKGGKSGEPYWFSIYGSQTHALCCPYDEILTGGERGGAKSAALIAWFATGNPFLSRDDPARYSYLLEPSYRGLMLRKEYQSLAEFVEESMEFFGPLGGKAKDDPVVFTFKSGAKIYTNHLNDKGAFEKFRGLGITRIGIEELTQIEDQSGYLKLFGSLRGKRQVRVHQTRTGRKQFPPLPAQIMSTCNPDGIGKSWVKKRFVKVLDKSGKQIPWNTPMKDPFTGLTRIFIPMKRKDNPYLRDNKQYLGMLLSQDEATRKAWLDGDWDFSSGTFFSEWRPNGPVGEQEKADYPWANHVIDPIKLQPWWFRFGGGDWGYDHPAAFYKFCRSEKDGRIHAYDELILRKVGSFDMGVQLANWWLPDLEYLPDKAVTIAFSSDAFSSQDNTPTKADLIAAGIKKILGPYGAMLLKFTDDERKAMERDPSLAQRMFERQRAEADGKFVIVLKPASKDTVARWSYVRELLRFRPVVQETQDQLKTRLLETFTRGGVEAYERELTKVRRPEAEILPRLQVWRGKCPGLVRCFEEAMKDEDNPEKIKKWNAEEGVGGDDPLEGAAHGLHHFKEVEKVMPKSYYVSERMETIQSQYEQNTGERLTDPTRLVMVQITQQQQYDKAHPATGGQFYIPRASSSRHRTPHGQRR